jgi:hypothetical protein
MRSFCFYCLLFFSFYGLFAQDRPADERVGVYRTKEDSSIEIHIEVREGRLFMGLLGQGVIPMIETSPGRYNLKGVQPAASLEFQKDIGGHVISCRIGQKEVAAPWIRVGEGAGTGRAALTGSTASSGSTASTGSIADSLSRFVGDYRLEINPYQIFHVRQKDGQLTGWSGYRRELSLTPLGHNRYKYIYKEREYGVEFKLGKDGVAKSLVNTGSYLLRLTRVATRLPQISNRANGFTRADTIQGMLTPLRSCYDVLFYDLSLTVLPETKSIRGSNVIRWRTVHAFRRMQVDLYENLSIDTILYHGLPLHYTRDGNAVYIDLPAEEVEGGVDELRIAYSGAPMQPDLDAWKGGIFWLVDKNQSMWIESVTQGIGASVYWPCKDHLSDRPDSMRISVAVPHGLMEISNGRLVSRTELPDGLTRFEWYVDYPIVTYDVAINVGDFAHFSDRYVQSAGDTLALNFYCLPYNVDSARKLFADTKRMLSLYEKDFGPYPFPRDGFTLLETIYPMEHQGAISVGSLRLPFNSDRYDGGIQRVMWHESAHEWWGNSVGCSDYADMWIHESFASYAEFLNLESLAGRSVALKQMAAEQPDNKEPIIGVYNVNHFHMGDMYPKGARMLETLRGVVDNDSMWFGIFKTIQQRFRHEPVRTEDVVGVFNELTGKDYTYFFDQYLRHPAIPVLALGIQQNGDVLRVSYKWEADVVDFRMPIKVTVARDSFGFIYPTAKEQVIEIKGMRKADFAVDTAGFYIGVKGL